MDWNDHPVWRDHEGNVLTNVAGAERYVMVRYERPLMELAASVICDGAGDVLNVGFGCGLVDSAIARHQPRSHTIVEPHPTVLSWMRSEGWYERARVVETRFEDALPTFADECFDGIFFDPYPFVRGDSAIPFDSLVRILRPRTGRCALYLPLWDAAVPLRYPGRIRGFKVRWYTASVEMEIPFVVKEWSHLEPGRHNVVLPWFQLHEP